MSVLMSSYEVEALIQEYGCNLNTDEEPTEKSP